jgi:hypothetical protein
MTETTIEADVARLTGRPRAVPGAVITFLVVLVGVLAGVQLLPTSYAATSIVTVLPRPTSGVGADTVQLIAEKYVVLATANDTMTSAGSVIRTSPQDLVRATVAVLATGTGNIEVTVTLPDRQTAAAAANAVAVGLVSASRQDPLAVVEAVAPAVPASAQSKPARSVLRAAGLLAALLAAVLVFWVLRGGTGRVSSPPVQRGHG